MKETYLSLSTSFFPSVSLRYSLLQSHVVTTETPYLRVCVFGLSPETSNFGRQSVVYSWSDHFGFISPKTVVALTVTLV